MPVSIAVSNETSLSWWSMLALSARLAVRDLRGGIRHFTVFLAALALGVGAIAAIGAMRDAITSGLDAQGRLLMGGDVTASRMHQRANTEERDLIAAQGRLAEVATLRAMARVTRPLNSNPTAADQALVELKAVDGQYPMVGSLELDGAADIAKALERNPNGMFGIAVDPILIERLGIRLGDEVTIGNGRFRVAAGILGEPDKLASQAAFGPRVLMSIAALEVSGLLQPGSLTRWSYRLALPDDRQSASDFEAVARRLSEALPQAGFGYSDRRDPSPGLRQAIERLTQFLTLVGLTALIVGGIGVANAITNLIDRKRKTIATFRSIGATASTVRTILLIEILVMAIAGIAIGLVIGALTPHLVAAVAGASLPIQIGRELSLETLGVAGLYGLLVTLLFALWPLGRAEDVTAGALFREVTGPKTRLPRWPYLIAAGLIGAAIVALSIFVSGELRLAVAVLGGVAVLLSAFFGLGLLIGSIARSVPRPTSPTLSVVRSSLGAPQSLTTPVTLSLGLGLSILITVALIDNSLLDELQRGLPGKAPGAFVLDIDKGDVERFKATVLAESPSVRIDTAPMLRGRLIDLNGTPVEQIKAPEDARWVLQGDRGLTFDDKLPAGSTITSGTWWPTGYSGQPLVSFDQELGRLLDLKLGDTVTVNVLGRNVTAEISNFRTVEWRTIGINFVMIFSPNTLAAAPFNVLATLTWDGAPPLAEEAKVNSALAKSFPTITVIRVKDAIESVTEVLGRVMTAVRAASAVTLLAGAIVLAGALSSASRRRSYTAVVMKAVGATRARILLCHLVEYLILWASTIGLATLFGAIAAYVIATEVMNIEFRFSVLAVATAALLALALVLVFGLVGTWRVLSARPVAYLRSD